MRFFVPGRAETKGSARGFGFKRKNGSVGVNIVNDNPKTKSWQKSVSMVARYTMNATPPIMGPIRITLRFQLERGKTVKRSEPITRPDIDKIIRPVLDALTGIVFVDDCQVVELVARKAYDSEPGVVIDVEAAS